MLIANTGIHPYNYSISNYKTITPMNTAKKTSDIISAKTLHIALSAVVTELLVEVRNGIYICVSCVLCFGVCH